MSSISVAGDVSGAISIAAPSAAGSGVLTLPTGTDTLVGKATTDTLTNKSIAATQLTGTIAATRLPAGSVLQVVQGTYSTQTTVATATFIDSGLSASITPSSTSSKILVIVNHTNVRKANDVTAQIRLMRGATAVVTTGSLLDTGSVAQIESSYSFTYLDAPNTISSVTYKTQISSNGATSTFQIASSPSFITLMEIQG